MTGKIWSDTYPLADLSKWLNLYRMMQAEHLKAEGACDAPVDALEAFVKDMDTLSG